MTGHGRPAGEHGPLVQKCHATCMGSPSITVDLILEAARTTIAERGPGKLTLSAVANAAGISRPTLYRWFPTKADLHGHSGVRRRAFRHRPASGDRRPPGTEARLDAALRYLVNYLNKGAPRMPDPIGIDPEYALKGLQASMGPHTEILARLLGDALLEVPAVRAGILTREQAAELFLRMAYSHYLVPHPDTEMLLAMMRDLAGISPRSARLMAG